MSALAPSAQPQAPSRVPVAKAKRRVYLSHSSREQYARCGRMYRYTHVDRLETIQMSANLGFGRAVHRAVEVYLTALTTGVPGPDPHAEFDRLWEEFCSTHVVEYSSKWSKESLAASGHVLINKFIEDWVKRGWIVVVDAKGEPVLERKLRVELPGNVVYTAILDLLAMDPKTGKVFVIDVKTPGQKGFEGFAKLSEQLLGQQVVVDAHKDELGIEGVDGRFFYDLYKVPIPKTTKGEGPRILEPEIVGRASDQDISEWIKETVLIAEDIRNGRFAKRPGDSFDSPCKLCAFLKACRDGDMSGLRRKG